MINSVLKKTFLDVCMFVCMYVRDLILWNIYAFYRENEDPNRQRANTLLKEIQEVEQIRNDTLCTERRVLGKLL